MIYTQQRVIKHRISYTLVGIHLFIIDLLTYGRISITHQKSIGARRAVTPEPEFDSDKQELILISSYDLLASGIGLATGRLTT